MNLFLGSLVAALLGGIAGGLKDGHDDAVADVDVGEVAAGISAAV